MLVTFELIFKGSTCCLRELDLARYLFLYGEQGFLNNGFPRVEFRREGCGAEEVGEGLGLLDSTTHRLHEGAMSIKLEHTKREGSGNVAS